MIKNIFKITSLTFLIAGCNFFNSKSEVNDGNEIFIDIKPTPKPTDTSELPTNNIDPSQMLIALTFDDGPRSESTAKILDVLERYDAKATFFITGMSIKDNTKANIKWAYDLGCEIGNQSYSHPDPKEWKSYNEEQYENEIDKVDTLVEEITGKRTALFRCPGGNVTDALKKVLEERGKPIIGWFIDTLDWKNLDADMNVEAVLENERLKDGVIILMHDRCL